MMNYEEERLINLDLFDSLNDELSIYCFEKEENKNTTFEEFLEIIRSPSRPLEIVGRKYQLRLRPEPSHPNQRTKTIVFQSFSQKTEKSILSEITKKEDDIALVFLYRIDQDEDIILPDSLETMLLKFFYLAEKYKLNFSMLILLQDHVSESVSEEYFKLFSNLRILKQNGEISSLFEEGNIHVLTATQLYHNKIWYNLPQHCSIPLWLNKLKNNLALQNSSDRLLETDEVLTSRDWDFQAHKSRILFSQE